MSFFLGVDVGTGSARAGVFDSKGTLLGTHAKELETYRPKAGFAQQASSEIWDAVVDAVNGAVSAAGIDPAAVSGIGFDATCSLVVTGEPQSAGLSIDPNGSVASSGAAQDVILWMDHRAQKDAEAINKIGGAPLEHVGGRISPEMELPKLRWLKRELPDVWKATGRFWDLPDWLVHRATGDELRSLCSTVCKWTYLGHKGQNGEGWDDDFLKAIGLDDLTRNDHAALGAALAPPGVKAGGLTQLAARELGLPVGTPVSTSLIDAHAGALGTLGADLPENVLDQRLALIAGTSSCHIALTSSPIFVPGIWGPYFGVILPDLWALEGGQSAAGALLDAVIARHSASVPLYERALETGQRISDLIEAHLETMAQETATLTHDRHVQPDFHGNRAPLADPSRKGAISGLTLSVGLDDLACDYLATVQALAYGTRHIIEVLSAKGVQIETLVLSGGLAQNTLFQRENADATGCTLLVPDQKEPVLLGAAMLAGVAAGEMLDLKEAMSLMSGKARRIEPRGGDIRVYHDRKYKIFKRMQDDYVAYAAIMQGEN